MDKHRIGFNNEQILNISFQPIEAKHNEFLFHLFKECRSDLAYISGLGEEQITGIIREQFINEHKQLINMYPDGEFNIVMLNEKPIGRFYINYGKDIDHIMELGFLEEYRGLGIGKKIINEVIKNAIEKNKIVHLQVPWFNQRAYILYEKLGFKVIEDGVVFRKMQYMS